MGKRKTKVRSARLSQFFSRKRKDSIKQVQPPCTKGFLKFLNSNFKGYTKVELEALYEITRRDVDPAPIAWKYTPEHPDELWNSNIADKVMQYIENFDSNRYYDSDNTALLLYGDRGSGKTCLARAAARQNAQYSLLEVNTTQDRKGSVLSKLLLESASTHSLSKKGQHIILVDDVDIVFEHETGCHSALMGVIEETKTPVILTCQQIPDTFLGRKNICYIKMDRSTKEEILLKLTIINHLESLDIAFQDLKLLVEYSNWDIGFCLNALVFLSYGNQFVTGLQYQIDFSQDQEPFVLGNTQKSNVPISSSQSELFDYVYENMYLNDSLPFEFADLISILDTYQTTMNRIQNTEFWNSMFYERIISTDCARYLDDGEIKLRKRDISTQDTVDMSVVVDIRRKRQYMGKVEDHIGFGTQSVKYAIRKMRTRRMETRYSQKLLTQI